VHAMKPTGGAEILLHSFLALALGVSGQPHASAAFPWRLGEPNMAFCRRENALVPPTDRIPDRPTHILITIPTALCGPPLVWEI